jgi:hypothetical protein
VSGGGRGRPRRWCCECLPSVDVIGGAAYKQRRKALLAGRTPVVRLVEPERYSVPECGRCAAKRGLCAMHAARERASA